MKTVKLLTCYSDFEAQIIKAKLEDAGIPSILSNENMNHLFSGMVSAFTGVDIFVDENQLDLAQGVIKDRKKC